MTLARLFIALPVIFALAPAGGSVRSASAAGPGSRPDRSGDSRPPAVSPQTGTPEVLPVLHISLIGDAGYAGPENDAPIRAIGRASMEITVPEFTAYLGDNVYGDGLPPAGDPDRARSEEVLETQLRIFRQDTTMAGTFIPGNHDWSGMGPDGRASLVRQGEYLRSSTLGGRLRLTPDSAQPGPVLVLRNDLVQVIALDSQWWLHTHDKPFYPGAPTEAATRSAFADSLDRLLSEFTGKVSLVLAHHPLETHGPHGGYFPWEDHVFPLRHALPWLWLPLPVIGSAYPLIRGNGYSEQDLSSDEYRSYIDAVSRVVNAELARGKGPVFVASGHEHDLQVLRPKDDLWYLVSGNGILDHGSPLSDGPNTVFASETAGYMTLDVFADGSVTLKVIGVDDADAGPEILFERRITGGRNPR